MLKRLFVLAVLAVLGVSTLAAADRSNVVFSVNGGIALPGNENFSSYWQRGYSFGVATDFRISRIVEFGLRTDFSGFPLNTDAVKRLLNLSPGTVLNLSGGEILTSPLSGICA